METDTFAVQVFPIAKPREWREFCESIETGERSGAHREMLERLGVTREHIFHQKAPAADVMVLVWEGVDQEQAAEGMGELIQKPQSEHERYLVSHVVRELHGIDPTAAPPPQIEKIATVETQRVAT
ncbi:MAG: hypothetical protein E6F93_10100 [Actinobacteria bacterium]|jgi:hypothetical protein|nr:MAG: hypothetical protein E6F93_10100 [Actinomycetota bacterium]